MRRAAAVLLALAASATAPAAQGDVADELPAILRRAPDELPRAAGGRWDGAFDPARAADVWGAVDDGAMGRAAAGERAYLDRRYLPALEHLYAALELEPDLPSSLLVLGTTYYRLRRYGDAVVALERFAEVAPGERWRLQALGHCLYSLGRYDEAAATYRAVLARVPDSVEAVRGLGLCHLRRDEPEAALARLEEVVGLRPDHADAWAWLAQLHLDEGRVEDARAAAERARELDPYRPKPHYLLALAAFALGEEELAEGARAEFERLDRIGQGVRAVEARLLLDPGDAASHLELLRLHHDAGDEGRMRVAAQGWLDALPDGPPDAAQAGDVLARFLDLGDAHAAAGMARALEGRAGEAADLWELLVETWTRLGEDARRDAALARLASLRGPR